jgi:D-glycero-D-manno-heptose 1,7-bisphosphate phosphatase
MVKILNSKPTKAVFLDRDGVIIKTKIIGGHPKAISSVLEIELLDGVIDGLKILKSLGFLLFIVTNQPDVELGTQTKESVEDIHRWLMDKLPLDGISVAYSRLELNGKSRYKPSPEMLKELAHQYGTDLNQSFLIGDRWRDIGAGENAGCKTIFIDYAYMEVNPFVPTWTVKSFVEATKIIKVEVEKMRCKN